MKHLDLSQYRAGSIEAELALKINEVVVEINNSNAIIGCILNREIKKENKLDDSLGCNTLPEECKDCVMARETGHAVCSKHFYERQKHPLPEKKDISEKYSELIMSVGNKYEGETRHQTALKYIQRAENNYPTDQEHTLPEEMVETCLCGKCSKKSEEPIPEDKPQDYANKSPYRIEDCPIDYPKYTIKAKIHNHINGTAGCGECQKKQFIVKGINDLPKGENQGENRTRYDGIGACEVETKQEKVDELIEKYTNFSTGSSDAKSMFQAFLNEYKLIQ